MKTLILIFWQARKQMKENCQQSFCTVDDSMLWQIVNATVDILNIYVKPCTVDVLMDVFGRM